MTKWLRLIALATAFEIPMVASAQELPLLVDHSSIMTLYLRVPFGSAEHRASLTSIGLGLNRPISAFDVFAEDRMTVSASMSLLDFRLDPAHREVRLNDSLLLASNQQSPNWTNPWAWVGFVVIAGGISCVTNHWPCEREPTNAFGGSSSGGGGY